MGLIARQIEAAGIPTLTMTSAWDITSSVRPPRAAFYHAPLGHQAGPPGDPDAQRAIVRAALEAAMSMKQSGEITTLDFEWADDAGWEDRAYSPDHVATSADGKPLRD